MPPGGGGGTRQGEMPVKDSEWEIGRSRRGIIRGGGVGGVEGYGAESEG